MKEEKMGYIPHSVSQRRKSYIQIGDIYLQKKDLLGKGTFGAVYLFQGKGKHKDKKHAVKYLNSEIDLNEGLKSLQHEETISNHLSSSQNRATLFMTIKGPRLVMHYIEGQSLSKTVRDKNVTLLQVINYLFAAATCLDIHHQRGVVHGDVGGKNIMVGEHTVSLIDYGYSSLIGTLAFTVEEFCDYWDPRRINTTVPHNSLIADPNQDVFSFGVMAKKYLKRKQSELKTTEEKAIYQNLLEEIKFTNEFNVEDPEERRTMPEIIESLRKAYTALNTPKTSSNPEYKSLEELINEQEQTSKIVLLLLRACEMLNFIHQNHHIINGDMSIYLVVKKETSYEVGYNNVEANADPSTFEDNKNANIVAFWNVLTSILNKIIAQAPDRIAKNMMTSYELAILNSLMTVLQPQQLGNQSVIPSTDTMIKLFSRALSLLQISAPSMVNTNQPVESKETPGNLAAEAASSEATSLEPTSSPRLSQLSKNSNALFSLPSIAEAAAHTTQQDALPKENSDDQSSLSQALSLPSSSSSSSKNDDHISDSSETGPDQTSPFTI